MTGHARRAAEVADAPDDGLCHPEPALLDGPLQPPAGKSRAVVADGDGHAVALVLEQHPGTRLRPAVHAHVVQGAADRRGQLVGHLRRKRHGGGRRGDLHLGGGEGAQAFPQVGLALRRAGDGGDADQGAQRDLLLAGQAAQLGRFAAELRAALGR